MPDTLNDTFININQLHLPEISFNYQKGLIYSVWQAHWQPVFCSGEMFGMETSDGLLYSHVYTRYNHNHVFGSPLALA